MQPSDRLDAGSKEVSDPNLPIQQTGSNSDLVLDAQPGSFSVHQPYAININYIENQFNNFSSEPQLPPPEAYPSGHLGPPPAHYQHWATIGSGQEQEQSMTPEEYQDFVSQQQQ